MPHQRTYSAKAKDIKREWHLVDVDGKILGRAATQRMNLHDVAAAHADDGGAVK